MKLFNELGISPAVEYILQKQGIEQPTPIQERAIPEVMAGRDVIAKAQTGTGKTLAFLLPIIEQLDVQAENIQALIVTPTRELALQITAEVQKFAADIEHLTALAVYGGQDVEQQLKKLKRTISIVVATPGRLLDHLRRGTIDLSQVKTLVLDEADQMLHIGFLPEVEDIIENLPAERQTLLFSATMPEQVQYLAKRFMTAPLTVAVQTEQVTVKQIRQLVIETTDRAKQATLIKVMREEQPFLAMIFCRTKRRVSKLNEALKEAGFLSDELHGDISQAKRERVMKSFREAKLQYLVATDVAARGLDVEGVTHVFNYDIPEDAESYIHRIGRTGRAGEHGLAITFIATKDLKQLEEIESVISMKIDRRKIEGVTMFQPTEVEEKRSRRSGRSSESRGHSRQEDRERTRRSSRREGARDERGRDPRRVDTGGSRGEDSRSGRGRDSRRMDTTGERSRTARSGDSRRSDSGRRSTGQLGSRNDSASRTSRGRNDRRR
ncbi:DEAD/DEAH box helicase [Peribacillus asahii]|uniref:DEAD/DEAH box helicase n=1 Tax=Peribacillus asahii TaxID=228899 RepID=UPI003F4B3AC5